MNEVDLRKTYEAEEPALRAWGDFVVQALVERLKAKLPQEKRVEYFLKIWPVVPRVKESKSFVEKALWRGKKYANPLAEITDKVGVRFVVLLVREIRLIEEIILNIPEWEAERARDFMEERREKPLYFDYQSLHYVVRSTVTAERGGVIVPEGTSCEIQVRTLLQHAYSELTHDTIYKPKSALESENSELSRQIARSMALIETSDEIFQQVADAIEKASLDLRAALQRASTVYRARIGEPKSIDFRLAEFVLVPFRKSVPLMAEKDLNDVLDAHPHLIEFVQKNAARSHLFQSSLILLIFWLIEEDEDKVWRNWPVDMALLEEIYAQLGLSTEKY